MGVNIAKDTTLAQIADALGSIATHLSGQGKTVTDWQEVQSLIRNGLGPKAFPVGSQIIVPHSTYGNVVFDVVDHDSIPDPRGLLPHSMTLLMHDCCANHVYDAPEALVACPDGLAAGTYNFTLPAGYEADYGGGKTYQFTLTQAVPAGGVLMWPWGYQTQASTIKVSSYASVTTAAATETVSVTEGTDGTALGLCDGTVANVNHVQRARYGSNRYRDSAVRQWINSAAAANGWWASKHAYDRAPSDANTAGLLAGFGADFLAVVGETDHVVALNTVSDGGGSETVRDRFFLMARDELGYGHENSITEGPVLPYYNGATNTDRIKLLSGAPRYWWLRTPHTGTANYARDVILDGSLHHYGAHSAYGVAAACTIY